MGAGARPSSFRKSGGFLNNVDAKITGYEFTDVFPGTGTKSKSDFHSLYVVLSARVDGADEDVSTTFFVGDADQFEISDDGQTLTPVEDGYALGGNTGWAKFITSLVEAGFPENNLPEDDINYAAIIGWRVRFIQRVDVETTKRLGKRKSKDGKKEYDRTDVVVDQVYGQETAKAGKTTATKPGKKAAAAVDVSELATETLKGILADNGGSIVKSKLSMKVLKALMGDTVNREAVRALLNKDEFLGNEDGWSYDQKSQTIELSE